MSICKILFKSCWDKHYGGEKAVGSYYNGATLKGINTKYASDKNWANAVFSHMQYLYNKL